MQNLTAPIFKTTEYENFKYKLSKVFLIVCVLLFTLIIFFNVSYSIAPVNGFSMYPTLNQLSTDGVNNNDRVVLNYIKPYKKGDIIVTSGIGGVYPADLILGEVTNIRYDDYDAAKYAVVKPYEDIKSVTDVVVLTDFKNKGEIKKGAD